MWADAKSVDITPSQALNDGGVDPITIVCAKGDGTSDPAISGGQLRLYQAGKGKTTGNTITFSSEKIITSIVFTFANSMTASNGSFSEGSYDSETSTWSGSTNSVTLTVTGTTSSTRIYITALKVYYEDGSSDPTLSVSPTSASAFTYEIGEGPSDDQMFEVTGSNLTGDITASITGDFEMTDDSSYGTTDLTLSSGDIVSVRLKVGLAKGDYDGTLTFSSTGATDVVIALSGSVTKSDPTISAEDVALAYNATSGSILYSIAHGVDGGVLTAAKTTDADWLTVGGVDAETVALTTSTNSGDERSATVLLTYTYDTDKTVTKDVTVTQGSPLTDAWIATDLASLTKDDVFVIVSTKENSYAMSNDNGASAAPTAVSVTISDGKLTGTIADNIKWNISGNATDGYVFYPNGTTESWLYCTNTNNGVRVGTNNSKTFKITDNYPYHVGTSRYMGVYNNQDWRCYTSINSNISDQTFAFYKKVKVTPITIAAACTDGEKCYGTFSSSSAFVVPSDLTVSEIKVEDGKLALTNYSTGETVPANTGVMVAGTAGEHNVVVSTGGTSKLGSGNMLKPSGDDGVDAATMNVADTKFYRLTMHNGTQIGFWWGAAEGAAFDIAANKAYLAVPAGAGAHEGLWFGDDVTGIGATLNDNGEMTNDKPVYNLAGQRVSQPTKGLYIVGGKKIALRGALR